MKGATTDEAFQAQCFLWERGAFIGIGMGFGFFNLQTILHTQKPFRPHPRKGKKKKEMSL